MQHTCVAAAVKPVPAGRGKSEKRKSQH